MKEGLFKDFPVLVEEWLSSPKIMLLTPAEEGGLFRLLLCAWSHPRCCLPNDPEVLAQLSRINGSWPKCGPKIMAFFGEDTEEAGMIFNHKQRALRNAQLVRAAKGEKGGKKKQANKDAAEADLFGKVSSSPQVEPKQDSSSHSLYSTTQYSKENLPPPLNVPEFREVWLQWERYRVEIKKPLIGTAIHMQLAKLAKMGLQRAIAAINASMANQWRGLFEPKEGDINAPAAAKKKPSVYDCL